MEKKRFFNFFFWNLPETTRHFSLRWQNSEYPRIFQVTGTDQNARKLLSTDLVNTKKSYPIVILKDIFLSTSRIKSYFANKDRLNRSQRSKVVYKASCWDWHFKIGKLNILKPSQNNSTYLTRTMKGYIWNCNLPLNYWDLSNQGQVGTKFLNRELKQTRRWRKRERHLKM